MAEIFISYARLDRERVEPTKWALEALGVDVFFDLEGIDGGDSFPDVLDREVKAAKVVLGCWTPHALLRDWVKIECSIALEQRTLVPCEFEPVNAVDVPAAFYRLHRINLTSWQGERKHEGWLAGIRVIARKLGRPELLDRARAAAEVPMSAATGERRPAKDMNRLWLEWTRLSVGTDKEALAELRAEAEGTLIATLAQARIKDLERPAALRLLTGSQAVGLPPLRGWRLVRFLAIRAGILALFVGGIGGTYMLSQERIAAAQEESAGLVAERDLLAARLEELLKRGGGYKFTPRNEFLKEDFAKGIEAIFDGSVLPGDSFSPLQAAYRDTFLARSDLFMAFGIDTPERAAAFLGQATIESGHFRYIEENVNYSAERLMRIWGKRYFPDLETAKKYERNPEKIANLVYANRGGNGDEASGDGWRYRGRGLFQFFGRDNYRSVGELLGVPLEEEPERMEDLEVSIAAAAVWWSANNLNDWADTENFEAVSRGVNRGNPESKGRAHMEQERVLWSRRFLEVFSQTASEGEE